MSSLWPDWPSAFGFESSNGFEARRATTNKTQLSSANAAPYAQQRVNGIKFPFEYQSHGSTEDIAQRYKDKCRDQCNTSSAGWHRNDGRCCRGLREDAGQLFGRGGGPSVVMMSQKNDISLTLCKIDSTARLPFFVICSVFICHKSGDANTKIPNSNTPETEHGMQSLECCDVRGRKGSGRGPSCISTTNIFSKWLRKGPS